MHETFQIAAIIIGSISILLGINSFNIWCRDRELPLEGCFEFLGMFHRSKMEATMGFGGDSTEYPDAMFKDIYLFKTIAFGCFLRVAIGVLFVVMGSTSIFS